MSLRLLLLLLVSWCTALKVPQAAAQLERRAALATAAALFAAPLPAFAKSKAKAEQQAIQKATRREAQQAMKEYKFAPRPELEGSMETGCVSRSPHAMPGSPHRRQAGHSHVCAWLSLVLRAPGTSTRRAR